MAIDTRKNPLDEERALETLTAHNVDGIIMAPCSNKPERIQEISESIPVVVLIDRHYDFIRSSKILIPSGKS